MMRRSTLGSVLISLVVGCTSDVSVIAPDAAAPSDGGAGGSTSAEQTFQRYLDDAVAAGLPGVALSVRGPELSWAGASGFADVAGAVPWTPETLGRAGSVTKLFASTLVSLLVERGDIPGLDVPLRDLVWREELSRIANGERVTLRQLLNHTSGIPDYLSSPALLQAALGSPSFAYHTKEQLLEFAYDQPASFEPGAGWLYSNTNYLLVELAVEAVTGRSGPELLRSLVIEPLALESTSYDPEQALPDGLAHGYADFGDGAQHDVTTLELERFHFDGGVISTVHDLADFLDAVLVSSALSESGREALFDVVPTHGASARGTDYYGLGLILEDSPEFGRVYGHLGTTVGFTTHVYRVMDAGITFAAIVNGSQAGYEPTSYEWFSPLLGDKILRLVSGRWVP